MLRCSVEHSSIAYYRMQEAAIRHTVMEKSGVCRSILRNRSQPFKADNRYCKNLQHSLVYVEDATYLGATFDKRMSWEQHLANVETKARKKLRFYACMLMKKYWSLCISILYDLLLSRMASEKAISNKQRLDNVQNQTLRLITGGLKHMPKKLHHLTREEIPKPLCKSANSDTCHITLWRENWNV